MRGLLVFLAVLAMPAAAVAQGPPREIAVGDDFFDPETARGELRESFHWQWATVDEHNVVQDAGLFDSGGLASTGDFTATPSAGTFGYHCELHGSLGAGMHGSLRIEPRTTPIGDNNVRLVWATFDTDTGTQFDVRRKVGSKKAKLVEEKTRDFQGAFDLKKGTTYRFQARTRQGNRTSAWSPKVTVKG